MISKEKIELPWKVPGKNLIVKELTIERIPAAVAILATAYVEGEPTTMWMKTKYEDIITFKTNKLISSFKTEPNLSVIITDENDEMLGVHLVLELNLQKDPIEGTASKCLNATLDNIYRDYYFQAKNEGRVIRSFGSGVQEKAKGANLMQFLFLGTVVLAARHGFTWFEVPTTNLYSSKACQKFEFKKIHQLIYDDFLYNGVNVFVGMDGFFTEKINAKRPPDKQLKNAARSYDLYEGKIIDLLDKASNLFNS